MKTYETARSILQIDTNSDKEAAVQIVHIDRNSRQISSMLLTVHDARQLVLLLEQSVGRPLRIKTGADGMPIRDESGFVAMERA